MSQVSPKRFSGKMAANVQPPDSREESQDLGFLTICTDSIRDLAYLKWEAAGCPDGDGLQFWVEAEQELKMGAVRKIPR